RSVRQDGGGRPALLRPDVFSRPRLRPGGPPTLRVAARGDEGDGGGGPRPHGDQGHRVRLPDPAEGGCARARDALPRRGRVLAGGDRRGGRRGGGEGARTRARTPGDREPGREVRARGADERVPA